ncbi:hypothetical protein [Halomonas sp. JS92-SW72]|uniref:hypothetical protein n=1 Tax=Halomonas sp. JS92-SW72 TaxID=2306583 RepID=UPI0013C324E5|nr:hypothetical protein [Halomonas sp. JS92-SW72]
MALDAWSVMTGEFKLSIDSVGFYLVVASMMLCILHSLFSLWRPALGRIDHECSSL